MRIVHFTDTHLLPEAGRELHGVDTYAALSRAVDRALSINPAPGVFLVTGDIADDGSVDSYRRFRQIFSETDIPVFVTPGNHDDVNAMKTAFLGSNIEMSSHADWGPWRGVFLNSQCTGVSHGVIDTECLERLENLLQLSNAHPILVCLHHPPLSDCPSSGCRLQNDDDLLKLLVQFKNVKAILSGHLHLDLEKEYGHLRVLTSPSTFAYGDHPAASTDVDVENFWASHSLDITKQGFRIVDLLESGELRTETCYY